MHNTENGAAILREAAWLAGYKDGVAYAIEEVFSKLKEDLRGYIGLNYLEDLKQQYERESK